MYNLERYEMFSLPDTFFFAEKHLCFKDSIVCGYRDSEWDTLAG